MSGLKITPDNCTKIPSQGGPTIADLRTFAESVGIKTKGVVKSKLCEQLQEHFQTSQIIPKPTKLMDTIKNSLSLPTPTPISMPSSIRSACPILLQPSVTGVCPDRYPRKFKTLEGDDCCGQLSPKIKHKLSLWSGQAIKVVKSRQSQPQISGLFPTLNYDFYEEKDFGCPDFFDQVFRVDIEFANMNTDIYNRGIDVTNLTSSEICQRYLSQTPTKSWLMAQKAYIDGLNESDQNLLTTYSYKGDRLFNGFIRNGYRVNEDLLIYVKENLMAFEFTYQLQIPDYDSMDYIMDLPELQVFTAKCVKRLGRIISRAPVTDQDLVVFRGIQTNTYLNGTTDIYANQGILSTTTNSLVALRFAHNEDDDQYKYMNVIQIPKGYPCLYNALSSIADEYELMLPDQSRYEVLGQFQSKTWVDLTDGGYALPPKIIPTNLVRMIK